ncbi:transcriptional regulator family: Fungal Specific TF [Penicillium cf. viridicatum]|uniref:Transcriptional regulator family: Fungal Specific TF n=1 Tax=Penicillium cf. viridicatum TaxID=2972119 RepID=A0A9W9JEB6_9EURO|nr:transcriptional regulator family: Fungal Specific TF [Penicillium cf. viridicatum]
MDILFVNVRTPRDALQLAKEPEVRSHVTRHQWKQSARRDKRRQRMLGRSNGIENSEYPNGPVFDLFTTDKVSISPQIGGLRVDPFQSYPVSVQPWTQLLTLLIWQDLVHMAVDIPELDLPGHHGLLRTTWFPLVMTEPALFSVIILLAASHYASLQGDPGNMRINLLSLRYQAVASINRILDVQRPETTHDALIGAIAKMASYEAMFGSLENYDIHMQGLARAISLRGGLTSLGLNGLLHRIVIWIDRNAAFLHGSVMYFPAGTTSVLGQTPSDPNPGQFLGRS